MKSFFVTLLLLTLFVTTATPSAAEGVHLLGDGPHYLNLSAGSFEAFDDRDNAFAGQVEWRFGKKLFYVGPLIGALANADGGAIAYAGIYLDLGLGPFVLSPQTGIGAYEQGDSKELGGVFEFISALGLSYEMENRSRLGARYEHISNANLHDDNPGANIFLLTWGLAL